VSRERVFAVLIGLSLVAAACSGGGSGSPSASPPNVVTTSAPAATPAATPSPTPVPSPTQPSRTATSTATSVPVNLDPCAMVTADEVNAIAHSSFAPGSGKAENNNTLCVYSSSTVVFEVYLAVAKDAATASAQEPQFVATLEQGVSQAGIVNPTLTLLPSFQPGVDAATLEGSATIGGQKLSGIAFYALKGAVFISFSDLSRNVAPPTSSDMQTQGITTLGRIP
jgi:hypothetical protein